MKDMKKGIDYVGVYVCAICHDNEGNVLFMKRGPKARDERGKWEVGPGGSLEFGETLEESLKREMQEEAGIEPLNMEYLGVREMFRNLDGVDTHWLGFYYKVLVDRTLVKIMPGEEHDDLMWGSFANYPTPAMTNFEVTCNMFKKYFK